MRYSMRLLCILFILSTGNLIAQDKITRAQYIEMWKEEAIRQMNQFHIPASIKLAQGIFESGDGNSVLAREAKNHFGIKCHGEAWKGDVYHYDDDEKQECFRKYDDAGQSYTDHSNFLRSRSRYASLFELEITDYVGWAKGLKAAGYATLPTYAERIIKIIEDNNLAQYDAFYGVDYNPNNEFEEQQDNQLIVDQNEDEPQTATPLVGLSKAVMPMAKYVKTSDYGRKIYENNGRRFVIVNKGDTESNIAREFDLFDSQLRNYNDIKKKNTIKPGDIVYIEAKKTRNNKVKNHTIKEGETLWYVSQLFGVKLKQLQKSNAIEKNVKELPVGRNIML